MNQLTQKWNAEDYAKNSSAQLKWAEELILKLNLHGNESVLDIGCGDGKISARIASAVKDGYVTGIDMSEDMIRLAKNEFSSDKFPNLSFLCMDAADIRLPEKFDVAFSNATLHWVKNNKAVLHGIRECLNPMGRILFQMGGKGNAADIIAVVQKIINQSEWKQYFKNLMLPYYFYSPKEYNSWLNETGFLPVRAELIQKDMQHHNDGLKGWLRTTWFPYADHLPEKLRNEFIDKIFNLYIAEHPLDNSGDTHVKMVRLEIEAYVS